jgi:hypothetical protein
VLSESSTVTNYYAITHLAKIQTLAFNPIFTVYFTYILFTSLFVYRPVMLSDVQALEKRLLQTIDMILVKKKRIALAKKGSGVSGAQNKEGSFGIWGMLKTVTTSVSKGSGESILL